MSIVNALCDTFGNFIEHDIGVIEFLVITGLFAMPISMMTVHGGPGGKVFLLKKSFFSADGLIEFDVFLGVYFLPHRWKYVQRW